MFEKLKGLIKSRSPNLLSGNFFFEDTRESISQTPVITSQDRKNLILGIAQRLENPLTRDQALSELSPLANGGNNLARSLVIEIETKNLIPHQSRHLHNSSNNSSVLWSDSDLKRISKGEKPIGIPLHRDC